MRLSSDEENAPGFYDAGTPVEQKNDTQAAQGVGTEATGVIVQDLKDLFPNFQTLNFCERESSLTYLHYLDSTNGPRTIFQMDILNRKSRKFVPGPNFSEVEDFFFTNILWADGRYVILQGTFYFLDEKNDGLCDIYFLEMKEKHLVVLSVMAWDSPVMDFEYSDRRNYAISVLDVSPSRKKVLVADVEPGSITLWEMSEYPPRFVTTTIPPYAQSDSDLEGQEDREPHLNKLIEVSFLKFIAENAFIVASISDGRILRYNIVEGELKMAWDFFEKDFQPYEWASEITAKFYQSGMSIHSDRIILVPRMQRPDRNIAMVLGIEDGVVMKPIHFRLRNLVNRLYRFSDDQILIFAGRAGHIVGIYNIRKNTMEAFSQLKTADQRSANQLVVFSPTQFATCHSHEMGFYTIHEKEGNKANCISREVFYFQRGEMPSLVLEGLRECVASQLEPIPKIFQLPEGGIFGLRNEGGLYSKQATLVQIKNFKSPLASNIASRTWGAICLLIISQEKSLPLEIIVHILTWVCSGYETKQQNMQIGLFSRNLALAARNMLGEQHRTYSAGC